MERLVKSSPCNSGYRRLADTVSIYSYEHRQQPCSCHGSTPVRLHRPAGEVALWEKHARQRRASIKGFESRINRVLMQARAQTLARIERFVKSLPTAIRNKNTIGAVPNGAKTRSVNVQSVYKPTQSCAKRLALDDLLKNVLTPDHARHGQYGYSQLGLISVQGANSV